MATLEEILDILSRLQSAYPHFHTQNPRATLGIYIDHLRRFSQPVLRLAADQMVEELKFFPTVAELVRAARHAEGQPGARQGVDRLAARRQALEDACWLEGHFDPAEWEALAAELERCGREFSAARLRQKVGEIALCLNESS